MDVCIYVDMFYFYITGYCDGNCDSVTKLNLVTTKLDLVTTKTMIL